jgi:hypothetical protein
MHEKNPATGGRIIVKPLSLSVKGKGVGRGTGFAPRDLRCGNHCRPSFKNPTNPEPSHENHPVFPVVRGLFPFGH